MSLYQSELPYWKTWRLRKQLTSCKKALDYSKNNKGGLHRLMIESLERDIRLLNAEISKRKVIKVK